MKRFVRWYLIVPAGLVILWLAGNLLLTVQLPDRNGRHGSFPDPMVPRLSLRQAYELLPSEGGGKTYIRRLDENSTAWVERWRLLAKARERLDISYFVLKQDVFGAAFLGHLIQKAKEGLQIRVLLDAMGTTMSRTFRGNDYLDSLVNTEKIAVRMYRPLPFRYLDAFLTLNPAVIFVSYHDKILLADGTIGLIGGRNISREYFTPLQDDPLAFRDIDIFLSGSRIGAALTSAFEAEYLDGESYSISKEEFDLENSAVDLLLAFQVMDAWLRAEAIPFEIAQQIEKRNLSWLKELEDMPHLRGTLSQMEPGRISSEVRLLDSRCRLLEPDDFITRSLIRLARSAREEIFIQSPYLVLPEEAADILAEVAAKGVKITILTNSPLSTDNPMSQGVFMEQWPHLLAKVPGLHIFVAGDQHNLHGKMAVFDSRLVLIGTYNLDPLSMALNSELVAAAWSPALASNILHARRQFIGKGAPQIYEYRIRRDEEGAPVFDRSGQPIIEFGPENHIPEEAMQTALRYRRFYHWVWTLFRESPLL